MAKPVIAIAGSSGLIGSALTAALRAADHRVLRIVRRAPCEFRRTALESRERRIRRRRTEPTSTSSSTCAASTSASVDGRAPSSRDCATAASLPPKCWRTPSPRPVSATLINASAVGYYGNTKDRVVDENDRAGRGFLAQLCEDWEAATLPAQYGGARVVLARTGLVFSPAGGALRRLRPLFGTGLGARLGSGRQYMSWISLEDEVRALLFAISDPALSGPGEHDRAGAGHQRRIHHRVRPGGQPADAVDAAGLRGAGRARRVRRRGRC